MVFNGQRDDEIFREYQEWYNLIIHVFQSIIDTENGNFLHLPFPGTIMDQPVCTMNVLKLMQLNYRKWLREEEKKAGKH